MKRDLAATPSVLARPPARVSATVPRERSNPTQVLSNAKGNRSADPFAALGPLGDLDDWDAVPDVTSSDGRELDSRSLVPFQEQSGDKEHAFRVLTPRQPLFEPPTVPPAAVLLAITCSSGAYMAVSTACSAAQVAVDASGAALSAAVCAGVGMAVGPTTGTAAGLVVAATARAASTALQHASCVGAAAAGIAAGGAVVLAAAAADVGVRSSLNLALYGASAASDACDSVARFAAQKVREREWLQRPDVQTGGLPPPSCSELVAAS
jgi:hypothetical protein